MPYIGNTIRAADDYRLIDDISSGFNGSATSFALQVAGSAPVPFPKSPQQVLISVNGVIQEPDPTGASGFNLVGTNIVFSSAPTNGHAFFGIIYATADYLNSGGNFPSGSLGAPSITFVGDEDTGIYRKGSGSVAFVADSTEIANTDSNGLTISSGNLIIPDSIIHNGDTNTKIRFPAVDTVTVETGGSERVRVDSSGNVGIGTTSPSTNLHLHTDANGEGILIKSTGNTSNALTFDANRGADGVIGVAYGRWNGTTVAQINFISGSDGTNKDDGHITFGTESAASSGNVNATERMRIDSSGKVGIGTSTIGNKFQVHEASSNASFAGFSNDTTGSTSSDGLIVGIDSDENGVLYHYENKAIRFATNNSERVRIDANGRVGIGLTAPTSLLHVKDTSGDCQAHIEAESGNDAVLLLDTSNGSGATADVRFAMDGTTKGKISFLNAGGTAGDMVFSVGSNTERMRLASDGDLGVGISSVITSRIHAVDGNQRDTPHYIFEASASTGTDNDGDVFMIRTARGTGNVNPLLHVLTSTSTTVLSVTGDKRVSIQGAPTTSNFGAKFQVRESGQAATTLTALLGANENASGTTGTISDNTNKACRIGLPHYDTDQKAAAMFVGFAGNGVNELYLGGGTGVMNGATSVRVYADSSSSVNNGGNQVARFDSDGLKFGTDTAAANALDDYEEGTFAFNESNISVSNFEAKYTKIGRVVMLSARIIFGSSSNTGTLNLTGLPFTPDSGAGNSTCGGVIPEQNLGLGAIFMAVEHGGSSVRIRKADGNVITPANASNKTMRFMLHYIAA